ncbi:MAG: aspartate aminotransferase family protein [Armatimonadetes bacterium]|nr:aspartate aminotransferase family protein [Armatimonadota bacterium]
MPEPTCDRASTRPRLAPAPEGALTVASRSFPREPQDVPAVDTKYRRIQTQIPVPESLEILDRLQKFEPRSMTGQPPVIWDRAYGVNVFDKWGNMWLDFSSGVLVTNAGHSHPKVVQAISDQVAHGLLHNYCFPSEIRSRLVQKIVEISPAPLEKAFLVTTGAETTECAIKLMRTWGVAQGGREKHVIVSYDNAFHGRTMGSQMAGGMPAGKSWIINLDKGMVQVPYPDGFRCPDTSFEFFLKSLEAKNVKPEQIAGVLCETYQGVNACLAPPEYWQEMRTWADKHNILITFDEVQAGFGRTGKLFGFMHFGMVPDIVCCGKGLGDGMPIGAVIGRKDVMDQYGPGSMTSTHTGNPVCCAAALASIDAIIEEGMVENAARLGKVMLDALAPLKDKYPQIGMIQGAGLVAAIQFTHPGTTDADPDLAMDVTQKCIEKGLMLFAPVGVDGCAIKLNPPLCIDEEALLEGIGVVSESLEEVLG